MSFITNFKLFFLPLNNKNFLYVFLYSSFSAIFSGNFTPPIVSAYKSKSIRYSLILELAFIS